MISHSFAKIHLDNIFDPKNTFIGEVSNDHWISYNDDLDLIFLQLSYEPEFKNDSKIGEWPYYKVVNWELKNPYFQQYDLILDNFIFHYENEEYQLVELPLELVNYYQDRNHIINILNSYTNQHKNKEHYGFLADPWWNLISLITSKVRDEVIKVLKPQNLYREVYLQNNVNYEPILTQLLEEYPLNEWLYITDETPIYDKWSEIMSFTRYQLRSSFILMPRNIDIQYCFDDWYVDQSLLEKEKKFQILTNFYLYINKH